MLLAFMRCHIFYIEQAAMYRFWLVAKRKMLYCPGRGFCSDRFVPHARIYEWLICGFLNFLNSIYLGWSFFFLCQESFLIFLMAVVGAELCKDNHGCLAQPLAEHGISYMWYSTKV